MKNSHISLLTLISGISLVIIFLIGSTGEIADPSEIPRMLYADLISNIIAIGMGIYLIYRYFQRKKEVIIYSNVAENSIEENQYLKAKQNRIFGYFTFFALFGSVELWVLNNYLAGFTLVNVFIIADLLTSLIIIFLAIQLLRNKDVSKIFVIVFAINIIEIVIFNAYRSDWTPLICSLLNGVYFVFAISRPISKSHYKLANYIVLPTIFVLSTLVFTFDVKADKLWENFNDAEQKSNNLTGEAGTAYQNFVSDDLPTREDISELISRLSRGAEQQKEVLITLNLLKEEYNKELVTESQILTLKIIDLNIKYYNVLLEENNRIREFGEYALSLNFNNLTDEQRSKLSEYRISVENYMSTFNEISFEIEKAQKELDE